MQPLVQSRSRWRAPILPLPLDFDVAAGAFALRLRVGFILCVGIGNAKIFMITAVGIAVVDGVAAFRRFAIAFKLFVALRLEAERNGIGFQQLAAAVERIHFARAFAYHQSCDHRIIRQRGLLQQGLLALAQAYVLR